ncbi:sensor histidine kinase [Paenibacillus flagellatus]|nr:sensor histidine kinase [Paenibacillus flagellatus]
MGPLPVRVLAACATFAIFLHYILRSNFRTPGPWYIALVLLLSYLGFIWLRRREWSISAYIVLSLIAVAGVLALENLAPAIGNDIGLGGGSLTSGLLWPLIWMLASTPQRQLKSGSIVFAAVSAAIVYLHLETQLPFSPLFGPTGLYLGVRGITSLKESHRISRQHLAELNIAHDQLKSAHQELQEATLESMKYAALSERARLARDIHDGIGHQLTSLIIQLQAVELMLPDDPRQAERQIPLMLDSARKAMSEIRIAVRDWTESENGIGLIALRGLVSQGAARSGIHFRMEFDEDQFADMPMSIGITLFRVLQEALTNVMKHSGATSALIRLEMMNGFCEMTISDNGRYTGDADVLSGFGIRTMKVRCEAAGGSLNFNAIQPHGLCLRVNLPLGQRGEAS